MSISIYFGAIRSWNVSRSPKSPKIHKNLYFGVQGHSRSLNLVAIESVYDFLLLIIGNLSLISHRYWDTTTYWLNIAFLPPSHLTPSFEVTPSEFMEKLYGFGNSSLSGSRRWRFGDPSLHRFWLINLRDRRTDRRTDGRTDRIAMAKTR